ncbi:MAG: formylglycine-generating enzyme family protein, partial [Bacteroidota bacterium]
LGENIDLQLLKIKGSENAKIDGFYAGLMEVTQAQWSSIMGANPSKFSNCLECPVETVSWCEIQDFLQQLSKKTGKKYRLPTEREWSYLASEGKQPELVDDLNSTQLLEQASCRGAFTATHIVQEGEAIRLITYLYGVTPEQLISWNGLSDYTLTPGEELIVGLNDGGMSSTQPVGAKMQNRLGLYDLVGNVWEWCESDSTKAILRGGSYKSLYGECQPKSRMIAKPSTKDSIIGFRVVWFPNEN